MNRATAVHSPLMDAVASPKGRLLPLCRRPLLVMLLVLAGCGGGDYPSDASTAVVASVNGTAATQVVAFDGLANSAALSVAAGASAPIAEPSVVIRRQPLGVTVRQGEMAQFTVQADGPHSIAYQWMRDDESIEGETGAVLRLAVTPGDHLARISVIVRAGRTTIQSEPALLRVLRP